VVPSTGLGTRLNQHNQSAFQQIALSGLSGLQRQGNKGEKMKGEVGMRQGCLGMGEGG